MAMTGSGAASITKALGGTWCGSYGLARCPAHDDREPSLKIRDDARKSDGIDLHCFAGCDWQDVKDALKRSGLLEHAAASATIARPRPASNAGHRDYALRLWRDTTAVKGTLAERYLREHRGIAIDLPPTLRFLARTRLPSTDTWVAALLAAVSGQDRKIVAVHATFIDLSTAVKIGKRTYGGMERGAVRLGRVADEIGLAEGIEDALSAAEIFGVPTWATLGAARLDRVQIPPGVSTVRIFADGDEAGRRAAEAAADRLGRAFTVHKHWPPEGCKDFNDAIRARRRAA